MVSLGGMYLARRSVLSRGAGKCVRLLVLVLCVILPIQMLGQRHTPADNAGKAKSSSQKPGSLEDFARHYEAARTFQISGDQDRAASEYVAFLAGALGSAASTNSRLGNSDKAAVLFDEALRLAPANSAVRLDYGRIRFPQGGFAGA